MYLGRHDSRYWPYSWRPFDRSTYLSAGLTMGALIGPRATIPSVSECLYRSLAPVAEVKTYEVSQHASGSVEVLARPHLCAFDTSS